jgi:hypothetical protein
MSVLHGGDRAGERRLCVSGVECRRAARARQHLRDRLREGRLLDERQRLARGERHARGVERKARLAAIGAFLGRASRSRSRSTTARSGSSSTRVGAWAESTPGRTPSSRRFPSATRPTPSQPRRALSGWRAGTGRCSGSTLAPTASSRRCGSEAALARSRWSAGDSSSPWPMTSRAADSVAESGLANCRFGVDTAGGCLHTGTTLRQSPQSRRTLTAPLGFASVLLIVVVISILPF